MGASRSERSEVDAFSVHFWSPQLPLGGVDLFVKWGFARADLKRLFLGLRLASTLVPEFKLKFRVKNE